MSLRSGLRFCAAGCLALALSIALGATVCYFGGEHACSNFIWPAAMILETGFEGELLAFAATVLFVAVPIALGFWFVLGKWGPLRHSGPDL